MYLTHRDNRPAPAAQPPAPPAPDVILPSTPAPPPGPKLDGTYQLVFDIGAATYSGQATPPKRSGVSTVWVAFRSSCTPVGCTAGSVKLDNVDHTVRSAKNVTDTFTFVNGRWENAPRSTPDDIAPRSTPDDIAPGCTDDSSHWVLDPQPDGTLAGTETVTLEGSCGSAGNTTVTPFVATRIGPVPAGLLG
jgi:serine/threonine protein kinase, bacterial